MTGWTESCQRTSSRSVGEDSTPADISVRFGYDFQPRIIELVATSPRTPYIVETTTSSILENDSHRSRATHPSTPTLIRDSASMMQLLLASNHPLENSETIMSYMNREEVVEHEYQALQPWLEYTLQS